MTQTPSTRAADTPVPVDARIAGLDRRTIRPAVALLCVWFIGALLIPWVDNRIAFDDPIMRGDVIDLGAGTLTFTPVVGWNREDGALLGDSPGRPSARLSQAGVSYRVQVAPWPGTTDELIDRMIDISESNRQLSARDERSRDTITNVDGVVGTVVHLAGIDQAAVMAAFVFEQPGSAGTVGVDVLATGDIAQLEAVADEIAAMISSTTHRVDDQEVEP